MWQFISLLVVICLGWRIPQLCQHFILNSSLTNIFSVGSRNWKLVLAPLPFLDDNSLLCFHCLLFLRLYASNVHCCRDTPSQQQKQNILPRPHFCTTISVVWPQTSNQTFRVLESGKTCLWIPSHLICGIIKRVCSSVSISMLLATLNYGMFLVIILALLVKK